MSAAFRLRLTALASLTLLLGAAGAPRALAQQPAAPAGDARQLVAVLDFEALGASKIEASTITDRLRELLLARGGYRLVDRAQMDKVLSEQALQQAGCTSQECAVQVGRILGVRKLVTGRVTRVDKLWVLAASLIDVETAETLRAVSVQSEGDFRAALTDGTPALAAKLAGPEPKTAAPAPAGPRPGRQGFTLTGGLREESGTFTFKNPGSASKSKQIAVLSGNTLAYPTADTVKFSAAEVALGGNYQWVLAPEWTLAAFLEFYGGTVQGDLSTLYQSVSGSGVGAEARYWLDDTVFLGGALLIHGETLTPTTDAHSKYKLAAVQATSGGGVAFTAGWEVRPRLTLLGALEAGSAKFSNADYSYSALRFTASYRWPYPSAE